MTSPVTPAVSGLRAHTTALARLVVPLHCAGCGRAEVVLCRPCAAGFLAEAHVVEYLRVGERATVPVWALAPYADRVRRVVLAWKSGRREDLRPLLAAAAARAAGGPARDALRGEGPVHLAVVPAPSGLGRRLSGRLVVMDLAVAVAERLGRELPAGSRVEVVDLLVRTSGSQAGRGVRERSHGRRVRALVPVPPGVRVLLVDDVLTTGATLAACALAVRRAGGELVGALVLARAGRADSEGPHAELAPSSGRRGSQGDVG